MLIMCTEYGSKPWVNPVLSKALEIKASSPSSRFTDPKVSLAWRGQPYSFRAVL
jgi:hypothetical protein